MFSKANVMEVLNAGVYAPLVGESKPMVEAVADLATPLKAGQGVSVVGGIVSLATDNATHIIAGSELGLTDGTYQVAGSAKVVPAVPFGLALIDCIIKTGETIVAGNSVAFNAGEIVLATAETQVFVAEVVEGSVVRIKFK